MGKSVLSPVVLTATTQMKQEGLEVILKTQMLVLQTLYTLHCDALAISRRSHKYNLLLNKSNLIMPVYTTEPNENEYQEEEE